MEKLLSVTQASHFLNICYQAVYRAIKKKKIDAKKISGSWFTTESALKDYFLHRFQRSRTRKSDGELVYSPDRGTYSPSQLAKIFNVKVSRVYYCIRSNKLKSHRHKQAYVIEVEDLEALRPMFYEETNNM